MFIVTAILRGILFGELKKVLQICNARMMLSAIFKDIPTTKAKLFTEVMNLLMAKVVPCC